MILRGDGGRIMKAVAAKLPPRYKDMAKARCVAMERETGWKVSGGFASIKV